MTISMAVIAPALVTAALEGRLGLRCCARRMVAPVNDLGLLSFDLHQRAWRPRSANWTDFQCLLISSYDQSNRCPGKPYSSHSAFRSRFCVRCRDTTRMVFAASNISTLNFGARGALKTTHVETVVSLLVTDTGQPPGTGFSEAETGPQNGAPCIRRDRVTEIVMKKARQRRAKLATLHELKENKTG